MTVNSPFDSPSLVSGWFDSGAGITESITSPAPGVSGTQYVCTGWTGSGSVPASGSVSSVTFTITQASTITWNWKTQYTVTFGYSGLDSSASGTVVTVDDPPVTYAQLPYVIWVDSGGSVTYSYSNVSSSNSGERFILIGVTGLSSPVTVTSPTTLTGNYKTQYKVTFSQSGIGPFFAGIVITDDSKVCKLYSRFVLVGQRVLPHLFVPFTSDRKRKPAIHLGLYLRTHNASEWNTNHNWIWHCNRQLLNTNKLSNHLQTKRT